MPDLWTEKYKFQHRLEGLVNGLSDDIAQSLEGALDRVAGKIILLESKAEQTKSMVRKRKYLDQQREQIQKVLSEVYTDIGDGIKTRSIELAQATPEIIDRMVKAPGISIKLGVPNLTKKQVSAWFESSQIEGTYLNDWLTKLEENAVARIVKETRESMILSESVRETAKRIQSALDIGRRSAEGMAHNSVHQAFNWAERQYYLENESRVKALRFTAELDRQTTPLCRSLDGKRFSVNEAPVPPLHWKCRSMLMPIFRNKALNEALQTSEGNVRIARIDTEKHVVHHRTGGTSTTYKKLRVQHPHADTTYNQWLNSMVRSKDPRDVVFAREVLGKTRFNLVKSGKLKMESLYHHGKLRTIKELKRLL